MSGFLPSPAAAAVIALLFGLVVGSFANVVIYRLPLGESIVFPASRCPRCLVAIRAWHNVPLISWSLLRGRCASCRESISFRYPAVEALHGLGFALIVLRFGFRPFTGLLLLFFFALVVLAFIDWDHQILPDVITLPGVLVGVMGAFLPGALVDWREAALSAGFGYVTFFLVAEGYARLRGIEGLGQGDWKLAAMMGAFLGGQRLLLTVFLGSLSGLAYGLVQATRLSRRGASVVLPQSAAAETDPGLEAAVEIVNEDPLAESSPSDPPPTDEPSPIGKYRLPFGTFLAASGILVLLFGDFIVGWYGAFFRY